jgi:glycosyltransferase involved in cell wall biosynthesis
MKQEPWVSVIIPTYNSSATIIQAIESVFNQTYKLREVIVVDDESTDDTRQVLDPYIKDGRITYLFQKNKGCGAARNNGAKLSKGKYLAFLDADDYWHDEKLARQVEALESNPKCVMCYTDPYLVDQYSNLIWETMQKELGKPRSGNLLWRLPFHNMITLSTAVVPRWAFDKIGGFTEVYELMMVADYDMWLKLSAVGEFYAITMPLAFYRFRYAASYEVIFTNYQRVLMILRDRINNVRFPLKLLYVAGWASYLIRYGIKRVAKLVSVW